MKPTGGSVDEFIAAVTPAVRQRDALTVLDMMRDVSGREPELWGTIVGFGSCHYVYPTGTEGDMPLLAFSPRKTSLTVYLMDTSDHSADLADIGPHTTGRSCLYLKDLAKNDLGVLRRVLEDSYARSTSGDSTYGTITVTS